MSVRKDTIPSLSEVQCKICMEILIEPITMPCEHTVCKPCFWSMIDDANMCCPFCHRGFSAWVKYHTERNMLVNMELWETIQKHYPRECRLRLSGQESEDIVDEGQPVGVLTHPKESRREHKEAQRMMEAERRAQRKEEEKAGKEYIWKLFTMKEEEEERELGQLRRDFEEQPKSDEELARKMMTNEDNSQREKEESALEAVGNPSTSAEQGKTFLKPSSEQKKIQDTLTPDALERKRQEVQDWLLALQLQKELDEEEEEISHWPEMHK